MRAIQRPPPPAVSDPDWLSAFLADLARADLAAATRRGYRYDLLHFLAWVAQLRAWRARSEG